MKKLLFSLFGSLTMAVLCIAIAWGVGSLFGPLYQGEGESTKNFKVFLAFLFVFVSAGGIIGFKYGSLRT